MDRLLAARAGLLTTSPSPFVFGLYEREDATTEGCFSPVPNPHLMVDKRTHVRLGHSHYPGARLLLSPEVLRRTGTRIH